MQETHKKSPHYIGATSQEQQWFDNYIETRDLLKATYAAYRVSNDDSARQYGKTVSGREHIQALIKEFIIGSPPLPTIEELKHQYIQISNHPEATLRERLQALTAYERLCGFRPKGHTPSAGEDDPLDDILD